MNQPFSVLYTIGYTGCSSPEQMAQVLRERHIRALIDVRSVPYSARFANFDRENLRRIMKEAGIAYGNLAREFGARQENHSFYKNGRLDFDTFTQSEQFQIGMRKVENGIRQGYAPVLMCAEKNPIQCHRAVMVARPFREAGYRVIHLLPDGGEKTQETLEQELLNQYFPDREQMSLFDGGESPDEGDWLRKAYALQNDKIGFKEADLNHDDLYNRFHEEDGGAVL